MVLTFPWHWVGLLGMPRRMAYFDYTHPGAAAAGVSVIALRHRRAHPRRLRRAVRRRPDPRPPRRRAEPGRYRFSVAVHPPRQRARGRSTASRCGSALMIGLTVVNYGFPIAQLLRCAGHLGACRLCRSAAMSRATCSAEQPVVRGAASASRRRSRVLRRSVGFVLLPLAAAEPQARGRLGRDLQRGGRAAGAPSSAAPVAAGLPDLDRRADAAHAAHGRAPSRSAAAPRWRSNARCATARDGMSGPNSPNLAGQYAAVIYKQLHDYKIGRPRQRDHERRSRPT